MSLGLGAGVSKRDTRRCLLGIAWRLRWSACFGSLLRTQVYRPKKRQVSYVVPGINLLGRACNSTNVIIIMLCASSTYPSAALLTHTYSLSQQPGLLDHFNHRVADAVNRHFWRGQFFLLKSQKGSQSNDMNNTLFDTRS